MEHVAEKTTAEVVTLQTRLEKEKKSTKPKDQENIYQTEAALNFAKGINKTALEDLERKKVEHATTKRDIVSRICPQAVEGHKNFYKSVLDNIQDVNLTTPPSAPKDATKSPVTKWNLIKALHRKAMNAADSLIAADHAMSDADQEFEKWATEDETRDRAHKLRECHRKLGLTHQQLSTRIKEFGLTVQFFETFEQALHKLSQKEEVCLNSLKKAEAEVAKSATKPDHETRRLQLETTVKHTELELQSIRTEKKNKGDEYQSTVLSRLAPAMQTLYDEYTKTFAACLQTSLEILGQLVSSHSGVSDVSLNLEPSSSVSTRPTTTVSAEPQQRPASSPDPAPAPSSAPGSPEVKETTKREEVYELSASKTFTDIAIVESTGETN
jgi:hypothetical protein